MQLIEPFNPLDWNPAEKAGVPIEVKELFDAELRERIAELESENESLRDENEVLVKANETALEAFDVLKALFSEAKPCDPFESASPPDATGFINLMATIYGTKTDGVTKTNLKRLPAKKKNKKAK